MTDQGRRLRLKVGDADLDDIGEGRARISRHFMDALDIDEGEFLRIHGAHPILVTVLACAAEDEGLDVLRLDATQRRRPGVQIGQVVEAERHEIPVARQVRLMIVGHAGSYHLTPDDLRPHLAAQPIMHGDTISIAPKRNWFDAQVNILGLTLAEFSGSSTQCGALLARVMETVPSGVVRVLDATEITLETGGSDDVTEPSDGA